MVTFWLAYRCVEYAERDGSTPLDRLVAVCVWSYADLLRQFDECPLILSEAQARNMRNTGQRHLETWANLRSLSALLRAGKIPNRNLWMILPKMHHLKHALDDAYTTRINPHMQNLLAAESWIGIIGRMARTLRLYSDLYILPLCCLKEGWQTLSCICILNIKGRPTARRSADGHCSGIVAESGFDWMFLLSSCEVSEKTQRGVLCIMNIHVGPWL